MVKYCLKLRACSAPAAGRIGLQEEGRTAPAFAGVLYGTPNRVWGVRRIGLNIVGLHKHMAKKVSALGDLPSILVGVSGEYFVAAELSRRGYIASITLRNTRGIDILAANADASRSVGIQVKTNRGKEKNWMLNEKAENAVSNTLFYVFVNLNGPDERPAYHVVPSKVVADYVHESHRRWISTPGRDGTPRNDTSMRNFKDVENKFLDRWELLGLEK